MYEELIFPVRPQGTDVHNNPIYGDTGNDSPPPHDGEVGGSASGVIAANPVYGIRGNLPGQVPAAGNPAAGETDREESII